MWRCKCGYLLPSMCKSLVEVLKQCRFRCITRGLEHGWGAGRQDSLTSHQLTCDVTCTRKLRSSIEYMYSNAVHLNSLFLLSSSPISRQQSIHVPWLTRCDVTQTESDVNRLNVVFFNVQKSINVKHAHDWSSVHLPLVRGFWHVPSTMSCHVCCRLTINVPIVYKF